MSDDSFEASFHRAEYIFSVASLLFYSGGIIRLILTGGANQGDSVQVDAALIQLIAMLIYAITVGLLVLRWRKVVDLLKRDWWIPFLILLPLISVLWSDFPAIALRRSIALFGTSLFGLYLASRYTIRQQVILLGWTFGLAIVLSFLFVILPPHYGISGGVHQGAWRGIFTHKNGLAQKMAMSAIVFLLLSLSLKQRRWLALWGLGLSVLLLLLARSTTGLIGAMIPLALVPMAQTLRLRRNLMIPAVIAVIAASAIGSYVISESSDAILIALGEDPTLTGRTTFWPIITDMIQRQPWLGYGYETFWLKHPNSPANYVAYATPGHIPSHAHNGFLQLWLHLGFVGVSVLAISMWLTLVRSLAVIRFDKSPTAMWPLLYCVFVIQCNMAETNIMQYNEITQVLYVAAAFSVLYLPEKAPPVLDTDVDRQPLPSV